MNETDEEFFSCQFLLILYSEYLTAIFSLFLQDAISYYILDIKTYQVVVRNRQKQFLTIKIEKQSFELG